MYDGNGKTVKQRKGTDGKARELGNEIEKAILRSKLKFRNIVREEAESASSFRLDGTPTGLMSYFLGCGQYSINFFTVKFNGPASLLYKASLLPFIESNFEDCTVAMNERLESLRKQAVIRLTAGPVPDLPRTIGFQFDSVLDVDGDRIVGIPRHGYGFYRDHDGFRFGICIIQKPLFQPTVPTFEFEIACNGNDKETMKRVSVIMKRFRMYVRCNPVITRGVYNAAGYPVRYEKSDWTEIKLPDELRRKIDFHIVDFVKQAKKLKIAGIKASRGIILAGKPGTGKTLLGRVLASNLDVPFILITARELHVDAPRRLAKIFEFAEILAPVVLFFEDGDLFLNERSNAANSAALSEFLNNIDGLKENPGIITIITANHPELLDESVRNRPKRFDVIIEFPLPERRERAAMLADCLGGYLDSGDRAMILEAAGKLENFTGAHITELGERLKLAAYYAGLDRVTKEMIEKEIREFGFSPMKNGGADRVAGFFSEEDMFS